MAEKVNKNTNMTKISQVTAKMVDYELDGLMHNCSYFIADVLQLPQYCTKPLKYHTAIFYIEISIICTILVIEQYIHDFCQHRLRHIGLLLITKL